MRMSPSVKLVHLQNVRGHALAVFYSLCEVDPFRDDR